VVVGDGLVKLVTTEQLTQFSLMEAIIFSQHLPFLEVLHAPDNIAV